jgi:hypothetical protein
MSITKKVITQRVDIFFSPVIQEQLMTPARRKTSILLIKESLEFK